MSGIETVVDQTEKPPTTNSKWRDRLLVVLVAFSVLLTLLWSGAITYGLGWLAWYLLR